MSIEIASSDTLPEGFAELPGAVYKNDPHYTPEVHLGVQVHRADFEGCQKIFLALRDGQPVARAIARISGQLGTIGFFEALDDVEAVRALLQTAAGWLDEQGCTKIIGPMDGDTWHHYRLNVGPFDTPPFKMEPYNPPYYPSLWTAAGFQVLQEYYSQHIEDFQPITRRMSRLISRAERSGTQFRMLDLEQFEAELDILYDLSIAIFKDNFAYTEISRKDFYQLYLPARPFIVPQLVWFALDAENSPIAFAFALPENASTVNLKSIGVLPSQRGQAVAGAVMGKVYEQAEALGFTSSNHCLIIDGNVSGGLDCGQGIVSRRYHLYEYRRPS